MKDRCGDRAKECIGLDRGPIVIIRNRGQGKSRLVGRKNAAQIQQISIVWNVSQALFPLIRPALLESNVILQYEKILTLGRHGDLAPHRNMAQITANNRFLPLKFISVEEIIDGGIHGQCLAVYTRNAFNERFQVGLGGHEFLPSIGSSIQINNVGFRNTINTRYL